MPLPETAPRQLDEIAPAAAADIADDVRGLDPKMRSKELVPPPAQKKRAKRKEAISHGMKMSWPPSPSLAALELGGGK